METTQTNQPILRMPTRAIFCRFGTCKPHIGWTGRTATIISVAMLMPALVYQSLLCCQYCSARRRVQRGQCNVRCRLGYSGDAQVLGHMSLLCLEEIGLTSHR